MNRERGSCKIELSDGEHSLRYTMNAVCRIEEVTGKGFFEAGASEWFTDIRAILWGGLLDENPHTSLLDAGELMDGIDITYIRDTLSVAVPLGINLGREEDVGEEEKSRTIKPIREE